jgi:hypothetical protein
MDNAVMQSQGNLLSCVDYFQWRWSHFRPAAIDKMKNLINYITRMDIEYKLNTRLDMLTQDGSPGHIHVINYFTKYRDEIFQHAIFQSDEKTKQYRRIDNFALAFIPWHERVHQGDWGYLSRGKDGSK